MKWRGVLIVLALLSMADLPSKGVPQYIRSHVQDSSQTNPHCLWWPKGTVTFHQSQKGNGRPNPSWTEFDAITAAWGSWQALTNNSNLNLVEGAQTSDRTIGYVQGGNNENVVLFRQRSCASFIQSTDPCWSDSSCGNTYDCWAESQSTIALTISNYETNSGRFWDADVEFNAADFYFTSVPNPKQGSNFKTCQAQNSQNCIAYDIQATMTHEAGHFLGLDHDSDYVDSNGVRSVMNASSNSGLIDKRVIDQGSAQFIADVYPHGKSSQDCVGPKGGCSAGGAGGMLCGAALLGLWLAAARRKRVTVDATSRPRLR